MKTSIKLTALALVLTAGIFTAAPSKAAVSFTSLTTNNGLAVKLENPGKAIVMIYDKDGNVLRKDVLINGKADQKAYILNQLENGDYTMEVTSDKQVVKKAIHVYNEDQNKTFIVNN